MKYVFAIVILLSGCAAHPERMDEGHVKSLMATAAAITSRPIESAPPVYLVENWAMFKRISCGRYRIGCALGLPGAFYAPDDRIIFVNLSMLEESLDAVIIHELVHHLQSMQNDKRVCVEREAEAYRAQQVYSGARIEIYERAMGSCTL